MRIDDSGGRPEAPAPAPNLPESPAPARTLEEPGSTLPNAEPEPTPAGTRFRSCRWSVSESGPAYCSNPEVLPYAGKGGFSAESWCLDCAFFKVRRKAPKRRRVDDDYLY